MALLLAAVYLCVGVAQGGDGQTALDRGVTWATFLDGVRAQREQWLRTAATATVSTRTVERLRRISSNLSIVAVAEDWCPDSVNTLPYVARLAASLNIPFRIVDKTVGETLMRRYRTPDGRMATPTIVLLRGGTEIGAFVERPAVVQRWFLSMADSPEDAKRFGDRQSWYDADRGQSLLAELSALAEQSPGVK
jgi:hypothetical protein